MIVPIAGIFQLGLHNEATPDEYRALYLRTVAAALAPRPFRRSDGRRVRDYVQAHLVLGDPVGLRLAAAAMLETVRASRATAVAGEVAAACALVSAIVTLSAETGRPLTGRYVRKETREYGIPGRLTAPLTPGSDVFR